MMQTVYHITAYTATSSGIAILAIFAWLYGFYKVYSNYKETQKKQSLYFSLGILFGALAIICLATELTILQLFDAGTTGGSEYLPKIVFANVDSYALGFFFSYLAILLSATAILMFDAFSLSFFENKMKFIIIPLILLLAYVVVYLYPDLPILTLNKAGTDYNPSHTKFIFSIATDDVLVGLFLIPLFFPAFVFLLSALQLRGNAYNFKRSLVLCFVQILIGIGYTIEIVGSDNPYLPIVGRLFILLYPYLTWNVLQSSGWVKKILGAPS